MCVTFSRPNYCGASTLYLQATVYRTIKPFEKENLCFKKMNDSNLQAIHYQARLILG